MNGDKPNSQVSDINNPTSQRSQAHLVNASPSRAHFGDDPLSADGDGNQDILTRARPADSTLQSHGGTIGQGQRAGGTPPTEGGRPNSKENAKVHPIMGNQQGMPQQMGHPNQVHPQQMGYPQQMHPQQMGHPQQMMGQQMGHPQQMMGHPQQMQMGNPNQMMVMNQQQRMPGMGPNQGAPQQFNRPQIPGQPGGQPGQPGQQFGNTPGFNRPMGPPNQNIQGMNTMNRFHGDNRAMQNMQASNSNDGAYASTQVCSGECTGCLATYLPCCCCCFEKPYKIVPEGYAGVILRFGKLHATVGPGMHYVLPEVDKLVLINKKEIVVDMKAQTVMSKDNTNFRLDSVLYFKMVNTLVTSFSINNLSFALQELAATAIRNAVGGMTIQQFLQQKEHFADQIENEIAPVASTWGAKVLRVLVQDVYLPADFQNTFSTSAVAKKISEAQVITSKAEVEVARLMRDAADALSTDAAFQIRYIDALEAIQKSNNPKMIFFPSDYTDVGKANNQLVNELMEETQGLLKR